jgi:hypothetical protein
MRKDAETATENNARGQTDVKGNVGRVFILAVDASFPLRFPS